MNPYQYDPTKPTSNYPYDINNNIYNSYNNTNHYDQPIPYAYDNMYQQQQYYNGYTNNSNFIQNSNVYPPNYQQNMNNSGGNKMNHKKQHNNHQNKQMNNQNQQPSQAQPQVNNTPPKQANTPREQPPRQQSNPPKQQPQINNPPKQQPQQPKQKPKSSQPLPVQYVKINIRKLPCDYTEEYFKLLLNLAVDAGCSYHSYYFKSGYMETKDKNEKKSNGYVYFINDQDKNNFISKFITVKNIECSIMESLYTKLPTSKRMKRDHEQGTIENDPDFIDFASNLYAPVFKESTSVTNNNVQIAPIVEFLRDYSHAKKMARDRNDRRNREIREKEKAQQHAAKKEKSKKKEKVKPNTTLQNHDDTPSSEFKSSKDASISEAQKIKVLKREPVTLMNALKSAAPPSISGSLPPPPIIRPESSNKGRNKKGGSNKTQDQKTTETNIEK